MQFTIILALILSFNLQASTSFTVKGFKNHTAKELEKNKKAIAKIEEVINGKCFEDKMLERKLIQTEGKKNSDVVQDIRTKHVDVYLNMYYKRFSKVNGYRNAGSNVINLNQKFHNYFGPCSTGSNIIHEVTHVKGYGHDYNPTKTRPFSVPYSTNWAFEACCKD